MNKAIGLIRVSTIGQVQDGCSLTLQDEKITAYALLNDLELVDVICEAGISGRAKKREGLDKVQEMVESRRIQHFIVYKLDRMSRSLRQAIEFSDFLQKRGVTLHSVCEKIDTSSPQGKLFFNLMNALSSFEADVISWRTKEALQGKKSRSERVGKVPYGMRLCDDGVHLHKEPIEQQVICRVKRYAKKGMSCRSIARKLNQIGKPTKEQKAWTHVQIGKILRT